jgi:hypothetical protein
VPFEAALYEGYEPRRAFNDETFPFHGARVHVFVRCAAVAAASGGSPARERREPAASSSARHVESKVASLLHHATLTHAVTPESAAKPGLISHDTLAPHLASSATARSLKLALTAFEDAEAELLTGEPDFARILDLLNTVYSTNDGELVVSWREETSHIALTTVMTCLMSCLSYACFPGQPPEEVMARLLPAYDNDVFEVFEALLAIGVRDRVAASAGMHGNVWLAKKLPP